MSDRYNRNYDAQSTEKLTPFGKELRKLVTSRETTIQELSRDIGVSENFLHQARYARRKVRHQTLSAIALQLALEYEEYRDLVYSVLRQQREISVKVPRTHSERLQLAERIADIG